MNEKNQPHWALAELAEKDAPAQSIHLQLKSKTGFSPAQGHRFPPTRRATALALILLAVVSLFMVPKVRAFAEDIFQQMGIAFVGTRQVGEDVQVAEAEMMRVTPSPSLSLAEIRQQITFVLLVPSWLPDGLLYIHRDINQYDPQELDGSGQQVEIEYSRTENFDFESGILYFNANDGPIGAPPLLADSRQQPVIVNGRPGIYVHGGWTDDGGGDPNTKLGILQWDDKIDSAYLTWEQDQVTYLLQAHNLGLEQEDLLQIAASMSE